MGNQLGVESRAALSNLSDLTNAALANLHQQQLIHASGYAGQRWAFNLPWNGRAQVDMAMTIEHDGGNAKPLRQRNGRSGGSTLICSFRNLASSTRP